MNAEFLEKNVELKLNATDPTKIEDYQTRKGLFAESFLGATITVNAPTGRVAALITAAEEGIESNTTLNTNKPFVKFSGTVGKMTISSTYYPETGIITSTLATS